MSERKNIDKLFQEQFKDFEVNPPEHTWDELEKRLKKKKKRRPVPIWWRLSGVAAALVVGLLAGNRMGWFGDGTAPSDAVVVEAPNPPANKNAATSPSGQEAVANADANGETKANATGESASATGEEIITEGVSQKDLNDTESAIVQTTPPKKTVKKTSGKPAARALYPTPKTRVAQQENAGRTDDAPQKSGPTTHRNQTDALADAPSNQNQSNKLQDASPSSVANQREAVAEKQQREATDLNNKTANAQPVKETGIAQNNLDVKSSEAAASQGAAGLAEGNQKADPTKKHTTNVVNQVAAAEDHPQKKLDSTAIATVPNALEELLREKENKVTQEPKLNRWQVTSNIAPIYFGSASGGSPIDSTFAGKSKSYDTQVSYGIGASYAINKRLSIRTGVNRVSLSYDTNDVELYASIDNGGLKNVDMPEGNETLNFGRSQMARGREANRTAASLAAGDLETDKFSGTVNQKMGYIEVPVELSYAIIDKKFGLNVIAGLSTLFLSDNKIVLTSDGLTTNLGQANNLNQTHFSSNVGLGVKYRFLKSFEANFEPIFKYQINTFSKDSGDFKPYFFGLYTGVSFRF